jgi:hypothetical protein
MVLLLLFSLFFKTSVAFEPLSISWNVLSNDKAFIPGYQEALVRDLSQIGLITVSDIPEYDALRPVLLRDAHECGKVSAAAQTEHFSDGTTRTSMVINGKPQEIQHGKNGVPDACLAFQRSSAAFRKIVDMVSLQFVQRVDQAFKFDSPLPWTKTKSAHDSLSQVVQSGTQLEHYHSYSLPAARSSGNGDSAIAEEAIDFHTDQGLFLAFSPAMMVPQTVSPTAPGKFWVKMEDGSQSEVHFAQNTLAFMLGDGVNHFINPRLRSHPSQRLLRATPHALAMPVLADPAARVTYGRMFLPPLHAEPTQQPTCRSPTQSPGTLDRNSYVALFHLCEVATSSCEKGSHLSCWRDCILDHGRIEGTKPSGMGDIWLIRQAFVLLLIRLLFLRE